MIFWVYETTSIEHQARPNYSLIFSQDDQKLPLKMQQDLQTCQQSAVLGMHADFELFQRLKQLALDLELYSNHEDPLGHPSNI